MNDHVSLSGVRLALLPLLFAVSCTSYLPFTDRIADQYGLGPRERPLLQYFVSDEFCLRRDTTDESTNITPGGTIRYFRGRRVEELRVRRHTPGAAISTVEGGLGISFVPGDDKSALVFSPDGDSGWEDSPEGEQSGRFAVPPPGTKPGPAGERYVLQGDATHSIRYNGKLWTVHYERRPYLLIRSRDVEDQETRVTTLPGRRVEK